MAQVTEQIGLSRDLIIHPGETLAEAIEERGMSQRELAIRTGMTEKHISTVISGQKNISPLFARRLEYALGIDASFWMNLQRNYDEEILEYEEIHDISEEEYGVLDHLKEATKNFVEQDLIQESDKKYEMVISYRTLLGVSNLLDIPKLSALNSYYMQTNKKTDPYSLYAWQRLCELSNEDKVIQHNADSDSLIDRIPDLKKIMSRKQDKIQKGIADILSDCGIAFSIVPGFKDVPAKGYIKKNESGPMILCVTTKQKYADEFWLSLFHELAHIINGDVKHTFIDCENSTEPVDLKADSKAEKLLIDSHDYIEFVASKGYERMVEIERFARSQNVSDFIVKSRLAKDKLIKWSDRKIFEWGA